ncbi:MAG: HIT family protein, partial [Candidatus Bathyarchaeota archaeon]|nr:HIT family protein [Candidatus Bathyarchaeota archaeon]
AKGEAPAHKVYEDEKAVAFLDIHPSAPGHTLIIPKAHMARVEDLPENDAAALFRALHRLVGPVQVAVDAPASTIGINNGRESGQEVPHVHIHVIPRSRGDRGGIIQGIARAPRRPNEDEMRQIAVRIKGLVEGGS